MKRNLALVPDASADLAHPVRVEGGTDSRNLLAALLATGASLVDGVRALLDAGADVAAITDAILDGAPGAGLDPVPVLSDYLWGVEDPHAALPALERHGYPAIRFLLEFAAINQNQALTLAGTLSGDMSLARAIHDHGFQAAFQHPAGRRYGVTYSAKEKVYLRALGDGTVCTPRDLLCIQGLTLFDGNGTVTDLSRSLDAIRLPLDRRNLHLDFRDGKALQRLPDVVEVGPKSTLTLAGCRKLVRLPEGLQMGDGSCLDMEGCVAWDRELPVGAQLGKNVTVVLPDGRKTLGEILLAKRDGQAHALPRNKAELLRKAKAMTAVSNGTLAAALADLELMGADRETLVQLLIGQLERKTLDGGQRTDMEGYRMGLDNALAGAKGLALEAIPRVTWAPVEQAWAWSLTGVTPTPGLAWQDTPELAAHLEVLPPALNRFRSLECTRLGSLKTLPEGTRSDHSISISACASFRSLPHDLACGDDLRITDCPSWDRILPAGIRVGGLIVLDEPDLRLTLAEWRDRFGDGPAT
jgi:hypothetical protein